MKSMLRNAKEVADVECREEYRPSNCKAEVPYEASHVVCLICHLAVALIIGSFKVYLDDCTPETP
jgi:hypothetical protein